MGLRLVLVWLVATPSSVKPREVTGNRRTSGDVSVIVEAPLSRYLVRTDPTIPGVAQY